MVQASEIRLALATVCWWFAFGTGAGMCIFGLERAAGRPAAGLDYPGWRSLVASGRQHQAGGGRCAAANQTVQSQSDCVTKPTAGWMAHGFGAQTLPVAINTAFRVRKMHRSMAGGLSVCTVGNQQRVCECGSAQSAKSSQNC